MTHYVPAFTRERNGKQEAFCGEFVPMTQHSAEPTCPVCRRLLLQDLDDLAAMQTWSQGVDDAQNT